MQRESLIGALTNSRIKNVTPLPSPDQLKFDLPVREDSAQTVLNGRWDIGKVLSGQDKRFVLVIGPCSVHDPDETLEYARWLAGIRREFSDKILFVMRLCFAKPRTTPSWRGFWSDPDLDGRCDVQKGWRLARKLTLEITKLGVPVAGEYIDVPGQQTVDDLFSMYWLGAREVTNQELRCVMSGVSCPAGIKNPINGDMGTAIDTLRFARQPHKVAAPAAHGGMAQFETAGNDETFLILRGDSDGTNYGSDRVDALKARLLDSNLSSRIMIDFNHGNSGKRQDNQIIVCRHVIDQITRDPGSPIFGGLFESYLNNGNQKVGRDHSGRITLLPRLSITDECTGTVHSRQLIEELHSRLNV